jgi:hypothetical protein
MTKAAGSNSTMPHVVERHDGPGAIKNDESDV